MWIECNIEIRCHYIAWFMFRLANNFLCQHIPTGSELWWFALSWFFGSHSSWNSSVSLAVPSSLEHLRHTSYNLVHLSYRRKWHFLGLIIQLPQGSFRSSKLKNRSRSANWSSRWQIYRESNNKGDGRLRVGLVGCWHR